MSQSIKDLFEEACKALGKDPKVELPYQDPKTNRQLASNAFVEVEIIIEHWNEGWEADYGDEEQEKWFPVFVWDKALGAFRFDCTYYFCTTADTGAGARFACADQEIATKAGNDLLALYNLIQIKTKD